MDCAPLRRNRPYLHLWTAQALSTFGSQASVVAIPLVILAKLHSASIVALVTFTEAVAVLTVLPVAGLAVDRLGYRRVMIFCDIVRALALTFLAWSITTDRLSVPVVLVCAAVNSAASVPFWPAVTVAIRLVVADSLMARALSLSQARGAIAAILGPLSGAALYEYSPALPLYCDAASYLVSLACILTTRLPPPLTTGATTTADQTAVSISALAGGWRFLLAHPFARHMTLRASVINLAFGGIILITTTDYSRSGNADGTGWLFALAGAGNLLGSLASAPLVQRLTPRPLILLLSWNVALFGCLAAALGTGSWSALLLGCCCVSTPGLNIVTQKVLLENTPPALMGRVQVAYQTTPQLLASLGPIVAAGLMHITSTHTALVVLSVVMAAMAISTATTSALRNIPTSHPIAERKELNPT